MNNRDNENKAVRINVFNNNQSIFQLEKYIIPLYQRAFAWKDEQIIQLLEDIYDSDSEEYYIGSLIVYIRDSKSGKKQYDVIDGQQRLTALYLIFSVLGIDTGDGLSFACREKSDYSLKNLKKIIDNTNVVDFDLFDKGIIDGFQTIKEWFNKNKSIENIKENFKEKLSKVVLFRIELPEHTDLNKYFEIMNTRGDQLEQQHIVKANMMSYLNSPEERQCFAKIWDACSDMTGYVQMHFKSKDNKVRDGLFGNHWNICPTIEWEDCVKLIAGKYQNDKNSKESETSNAKDDWITESLNSSDKDDAVDGVVDDVTVRFNSIIEFPYFLLHSLKAFLANKANENENQDKNISLDDKKLVASFIEVAESSDAKEKFSKDFILFLLKTRFMFDKYIIKREFTMKKTDSEGVWSLKSVNTSGQQGNKKAYYTDTEIKQPYKPDQTESVRMIQSALRVSFTSPKAMHWITNILKWFWDTVNTSSELLNKDEPWNILNKLEEISKEPVKKFLTDNNYNLGVGTPHIVFNYLDYLLWKENPNDYNDFSFEFRNSVEHFYPQNPSDGSFDRWDDKDAKGNREVDRFGNLCLVTRRINSKFSNLSPKSKYETYAETMKKGSIKLRIMTDMISKNDSINMSIKWKNELCEEHENKMIGILKEACGIE